MITLDDAPEELTAIKVEVFNPESPFGGVQVIGVTDTPIQVEFNTGSPVSSVFGRVGAVQPQCGDYDQCYAPLGSTLPPGGSHGQVLTKEGTGAYSSAWSSISAGVASVLEEKKIFVNKGGNDSTGVRGDLTKPFLSIAAATAAPGITAGDVILVGPGTYTENAGVELPDDVSLIGMGRSVSRIESTLLGTSAPFHGIVAPGNNSFIGSLSIIAVSPTGTGIEHVNAISRRSGAIKSWTNVVMQDCYLYGLADVVIAGGASLGDMTFIDCFLDGPNDAIMWQTPSNLLLVNCELRHTTLAGHESLSGIGIYDGGSGGTVRAYGCRYVLGGVNPTGAGIFPVAADSHVEIYDLVIDYAGKTPGGSSRDLNAWTPGALFVSNIRKTGNGVVTYDGAPIEIPPASARTVAFLPASPQIGQTATVTDGAAALNFGDNIAAGGSSKYGVWWNGSNWKVVAGGAVSAGGSHFRTSTILPDSNSVTPNASFDMSIENNTQATGTMTINAPSGSPVEGQGLLLRIKLANAQSVIWNPVFRGSAYLALPGSLSGGRTSYLGFVWNNVDSKWDHTMALRDY